MTAPFNNADAERVALLANHLSILTRQASEYNRCLMGFNSDPYITRRIRENMEKTLEEGREIVRLLEEMGVEGKRAGPWLIECDGSYLLMVGDSSAFGRLGDSTARFHDYQTANAVGCMLRANGSVGRFWNVVTEREARA